MLSLMAADTLATNCVMRYVSALVDKDKHADVRLEAAIGKLLGSEKSWRIMDDTMQIRGGCRFETAESLKARGEMPEPVERLFRDSRINTIFEGSSEALEPHLRLGAEAVNSALRWKVLVKAAMCAAMYYTTWYPMKWLPYGSGDDKERLHPDMQADAGRFGLCARLSRKLAHEL
jgi:hypothetical protein